MSDTRSSCHDFEEWLAAGGPAEPRTGGDEWRPHLDACAECRRQWRAHELLVAAFAGAAMPRLSPGFEAGLERKLAGAGRAARPLAGWRRAAMLAYGLAALGLLGWLLRGVPLPSIDISAPWLALAAFAAVPLTLATAIAVSRWLPAPRAGGMAPLAL